MGYGATGGVQRVALWNQAVLELVGPVRAKVVPGPDESDYLALADGRFFLLLPGASYRFSQEGDSVVAKELPEGVVARAAPDAAPTPQSQTQPPTQPEAAPWS